MAKKLIKVVRAEGQPRICKVYRDTEWGEFQVKMILDDVVLSTYYTDCKVDALATADAMLSMLPLEG